MNLHLLYEDRDILVVNKPQGMVVHHGVHTYDPTLVDVLSAYTTLVGGEEPRKGIVHRLDKDTVGLMVVSKSEAAYTHLVEQFKEKQVIKKYYAYVRGDVTRDEVLIDLPIGRDSSKRIRQRVFPKGGEGCKDAVTHVRVLQRFRTKTLVELRPETGRMHQLRVHMAHIGFPVLGDPIYGPSLNSATGQQLQAFFLGFDHPTTGVRITFTLPLLL